MDDVSPANVEAQRWLVIAWKLLEARDFPAAKKFAERAIDADPLLDGPDQILAAADVLLASQQRLPSGDADHYYILQLPRHSDLPSIKRSFRRLTLLLRHQSSSPPNPIFHLALDLVSDSFSFLSDDDRRLVYDRDLPTTKENSNSNTDTTTITNTDTDTNNNTNNNTSNRKLSSPPPRPQREEEKKIDEEEKKKSFWTVCPNCFRAFEYAKEYEGRRLRCHVCKKPFHAVRLPSPPPVIPGTDMFYCSWGLFPIGFPGFSSIQLPSGTTTVPSLPSYLPVPEKDKGELATSTRTNTRPRARMAAPSSTRTTGTRGKKSMGKLMAKRPRRGQVEADHSDRVGVQCLLEDDIGSGSGSGSGVQRVVKDGIGGGGDVGVQSIVEDGIGSGVVVGVPSVLQDGTGGCGGVQSVAQ